MKQELKVELGEYLPIEGECVHMICSLTCNDPLTMIGYQDDISLPTEVLSQPQESISDFGEHHPQRNDYLLYIV